jgi:hypothetical protein
MTFSIEARPDRGTPERLKEGERNRHLRRVDWRFLLPDPAPAHCLCLGSEAIAAGLGFICGDVVSGLDVEVSDRDLVVAVNPSLATLKLIRSRLQPGGACYTEWSLVLPGARKRVRRRLAAAGFVDVRCYWCWPTPGQGQPSFWLPLDAPGALRHFLATRAPGLGLLARTRNAIRRRVWQRLFRLGMLGSLCVTACTPPDPKCGRAHPVMETIRDRWVGWGLGPTPPNNLSVVLLTGGERAINKVVGLVGAEPQGQPRVALKMARTEEARTGLNREATVLSILNARRAGNVPGVPQVLFFDPATSTLAETALTGLPLVARPSRDTFRNIAQAATIWLSTLAGQEPPVPQSAWWDRLVAPVLAEFEQVWGSVVDPHLPRTATRALGGLGALPLVCEQRDFAPWNVLADQTGALTILDWESAEPDGLPALDLIYFLSYLSFFRDGATRTGRVRASYRASLDPRTFTGGVRAACLARYARETGLDLGALPGLSMLTWMVHARSEYRRFVADAGGPPGLDLLRSGVFAGLLEEEARVA